jgi:high-affinity K+ transport system ATPase subunit B
MENTYKEFIVFLLFISCFADIFTTTIHKQFIQLETNFLFPSFGILIIILIKLIVTLLITIAIFKTSWFNKTNMSKFFYINISVMLIIMQFYAAYSNTESKEKIKQDINLRYMTNYTSFSEVEENYIKEYVPTKEKGRKQYFNFMTFFYIIPFFISLISFWLFERCYDLEKIENI